MTSAWESTNPRRQESPGLGAATDELNFLAAEVVRLMRSLRKQAALVERMLRERK